MKKTLVIAWMLVFCANAQAAPLFLTAQQDLSFGEMAIYSPGAPGYVEINATTGAVVVQNAALLIAPTRGAFIMEGNDATPIVFSILVGTPVCDLTYINPCLGTPSITVTHTFGGQITGNFCPKRPKCQDTVIVGGRFAFSGIEEGRWNSTLTITANYQ